MTTTTFSFRNDRSAGLEARTLRWLVYEQTVNERIFRDSTRGPIFLSNRTIEPAYRPERQGAWPQQVVWLPADRVRAYGSFQDELAAAFGHEGPDGRLPLFVHPQAPAAHRNLRAKLGGEALPGVWATPTASCRSVLTWRQGHGPVILKLSLGARFGRARRTLTEKQVASAVVVNGLLETIPVAKREEIGLDWFPEAGGLVETGSRCGWLLRTFPRSLSRYPNHSLIPAFSLVSPRGDRPPVLVDLLRSSGRAAEEFVIDELLRPYVRTLAYLLFEEGIHTEGHTQNVLLELDADERLTGRIVLRDLSDMTVSLALRTAKGKPLPSFEGRAWPIAPFALATVASEDGRRPRMRARDTVERYGLGSFLGAINASLARYVPGHDSARVEDTYLSLWQEQAVRFLNVKPMFRAEPKGLATDEALAYFLKDLHAGGGSRAIERAATGPA